MDRAAFERLLKRRSSRRAALGAGAVGGAGIIGMSFAGGPTRLWARQATPAGGTPQASPAASPVASPVATESSTLLRPSARFGAYPFQLGVASGDPAANSVVLWTRLAPSPIDGGGMDGMPYDVAWEVANDETFGNIVQRGIAVADPNLAHSVHVDVTGLEPAREYFYRFMAGGEVSQTGRTKTAPAAGQAVDALRLGIASCSNYEHGYFIGYREMANQRLDLILHLGDYIYEYEANDYQVREPENLRLVPDDETVTLSGYRNRYALYRTDPDLQAAHASAPFSVTWDDHEVDNNYADEISEEQVSVDVFRQRRADAYQAYYEHMPLRPSSLPVGPDLTLYRKLHYGDLLSINVLDTRQYRSDQPAGDGTFPRSPANLDPRTTLLGPDQERWLLQALDESPSIWNVLAQQVTMAETYFPPADGSAIEYYNDAWSGYPVARSRILDHIARNAISNPVVLTGDIHTSWAGDLLSDWTNPESAVIGSEYVCTSITAGGLEPADFFQAYKDAFPYIKFFDPRHGGFTVAEVSANLWKADYFVVDNMEDPASGVTNIGTFVTEAGTPGVQQG